MGIICDKTMKDANLAPVILFLYNRLDHTKRTVEALQRNDLAAESDLYVFCDGPKQNATSEQLLKVQEVQSFAEHITGFRNVFIKKQSQNKGLANSVISGVSEVTKKYGRVIVVEDDIVTHPFFLRFMNDALVFYGNDKRIFTIGGMTDKIDIPKNYKKDVLVSQRVESWGWATWADRWFSAEWDISKYSIWGRNQKKGIKQLCRGGDDLWRMLQMQNQKKIDSWAVRWQYNMSNQNKYCLRPVLSFVVNVGLDGSGVHCSSFSSGTAPSTPLYDSNIYDIKLERGIKENSQIRNSLKRYYALAKESKVIRLKTCIYENLMIINRKLTSLIKND